MFHETVYYYDKLGRETSRWPNINSEEPTVVAIFA
jgi:hypothetical protein